MKRKGIITATALVVIALVSVLAVLNPLGIGNSTPSGNSTSNGNSAVNGSTELGDHGEPTNPGNETLETTFGITPGKFYLDKYMAGESEERQLLIENKNGFAANFTVDYRVPDWVEEGYSRPTSEVRDWVWISNRRPEIPAHGTLRVTIRLGMPSYATPPGDKWEFWIGVIDQSQTGWLMTELANRWLVTMATE